MFSVCKLSTLALTVALLGCGPSSPSSSVKILGGVENYSLHPMAVGMAVMPQRNGRIAGVCTASVVSDRLVMMAAHCVTVQKGQPKNDFAVVFDRFVDVPTLKKEGAFSDFAIVFPGWDPIDGDHLADNSDVAFAVFPSGSFPQDRVRQIGRIAATSAIKGQRVGLAGYGETIWVTANSNPQLKRFVGSNIVASVDPGQAGLITLASNQVGETTAGGASGDSGGPLLNDQDEIVGIAHTAWNASEQDGNDSISVATPHYTTYTNVTDAGISCFIKAVMNDPHPNSQSGHSCKPTPTDKISFRI